MAIIRKTSSPLAGAGRAARLGAVIGAGVTAASVLTGVIGGSIGLAALPVVAGTVGTYTIGGAFAGVVLRFFWPHLRTWPRRVVGACASAAPVGFASATALAVLSPGASTFALALAGSVPVLGVGGAVLTYVAMSPPSG